MSDARTRLNAELGPLSDWRPVQPEDGGLPNRFAYWDEEEQRWVLGLTSTRGAVYLVRIVDLPVELDATQAAQGGV